MKALIYRIALFTGLLLTVYGRGFTQANLLDWSSSFVPAWAAGNTSGSAPNIGGSGVNCTVNIAFVGSGSFIAPYPRVNANNSNAADFQVQSSSDALEIDQDLANKTSYSQVTFTFSKAVQNLQFGISDIDFPGGGTPYNYTDLVTISASGPNGAVAPVITKYNNASAVFGISGNVCTANQGAGGANVSSLVQGSPAQDGTAFIDFGTGAITTVTIQYGTVNNASVRNNPRLQAISIGNLTFIPVSSLPIGLTAFEAQVKDNQVKLDWRTASGSEEGLLYVERSRDGILWEKVPSIAALKVRGETKYSATDIAPNSSISFYRLKQVSFNGEELYSRIIRINLVPSATVFLRTYPNPFQSNFNMELNWPAAEKVSIRLYSIVGQLLYQSSASLQKGFQVLSMPNLSSVPKGKYSLQVTGNYTTQNIIVSKQ